MTQISHEILPEELADCDVVERLALDAFGPGMFTRTAFRLRENVPHEPDLAFKAVSDNQIAGSVRLTKIRVDDQPALLLGPLVVCPNLKSKGIGADLMQTAVRSAREAGEQLIILVGDLSYYQKFGFEPVPNDQITLPGPVDPGRLLYCELRKGAFDLFHGMASRFANK